MLLGATAVETRWLMPDNQKNLSEPSSSKHLDETRAKPHLGLSIFMWVVFILAGIFFLSLFGMMGPWH